MSELTKIDGDDDSKSSLHLCFIVTSCPWWLAGIVIVMLIDWLLAWLIDQVILMMMDI